jgi:hypothetical protein
VRILVFALAACNASSCAVERATPQPSQEKSPPAELHESAEPSTTQPGAKMSKEPLLQDGAMLLFEKISLGNEPEANRRWRVDTDGTVWFSKNKPPVPAAEDFNQPLAKLAEISQADRDSLLAAARESGFWEAPEHVEDKAVEDGMRLQLTIRDGERVRRIQADNTASPAIEAVTQALFGML